MYLKTNKVNRRLLNKNDDVFVNLFNVVDNVMKLRTKEEFGFVNSAKPVNNMEEGIWNTGVLGEHTPVQLLDTVMFQIGINCSLRGGKEHRYLRRPGFNEQITVTVDDNNVKCLKIQHDVQRKKIKGG